MRVILDNGHGIDTKGKRSPVWKDGTQLFEYELARDIVERIAHRLDSVGIRYKILVPEMRDISLEERCKRANDYAVMNDEPCFLISIHANAGGGTGFECFTSRGKTASDEIATEIYRQMEGEFSGWRMRKDTTDGDPDKEAGFYILRHTICPAVLTENFFMDNERDCKALMQDDFRERIADAHVAAIRNICTTF